MFRTMLSYGLIAGLLVGVPLSATTALSGHHEASYGYVIGYLTMLIALSMVFVAVKRYRDIDLGGVIKFWPAFGLGLGISFIASILYVAAWEATCAAMHLDFAGSYAKSVIAHQQAKGVSAEALAKVTAAMEAFKVQYANPFYRLPMTFAEIFPAGLLRNSHFSRRNAAPCPTTASRRRHDQQRRGGTGIQAPGAVH